MKETSLAFKRNCRSAQLPHLRGAGRRPRPPRLLIDSEDAKTEEEFVLVGNGSLTEGRFLFKHAVIDDGLLGVSSSSNSATSSSSSICRTSSSLPRLRRGKWNIFRRSALRVSRTWKKCRIELDGELAGTCPVEFRMEPRRQRGYLRQSDWELPARIGGTRLVCWSSRDSRRLNFREEYVYSGL